MLIWNNSTIDELVEDFDYLLPGIFNNEHLIPKLDGDGHSDTSISFEDTEGLMLFFSPDRRGRIIAYLQRAITVPGVRTMPNGDPGYPDECDYQELIEFSRYATMGQIVKAVVLQIATDMIQCLKDEKGIKAMAEEHSDGVPAT